MFDSCVDPFWVLEMSLVVPQVVHISSLLDLNQWTNLRTSLPRSNFMSKLCSCWIIHTSICSLIKFTYMNDFLLQLPSFQVHVRSLVTIHTLSFNFTSSNHVQIILRLFDLSLLRVTTIQWGLYLCFNDLYSRVSILFNGHELIGCLILVLIPFDFSKCLLLSYQ